MGDARIDALRAVMVDPKSCAYCEGTGWVFNDKSYNGYPYGRGPYVEPDDLNGGYSPCLRCNDDREVEFGSGATVKPWRRWDDGEVAEIANALDAVSASECEKLRTALDGLVEAWDEVRDEIHRMSVFAQLHSEPYRGRNISPLFDAARALVGSVPQNEADE